jgi:YqaJ-like viral recombinase domain
MWSTILQIQYEDYILTDDDVKVLHYKCQQFYTNVCDAVPDPIPCHLVNTLGQAHNETWHQQRWFRLTASSCKEAVTCKTNKSLTEYLKKTLWGLGKTQTAAMAYGIRHKQAAFDEYANRQSASNDTLSVEKSGMWVNGRYPGFGCSPDGLVEEAGNSGLLEIKCPKILQNIHPLALNELTKNQLNSFCCKLVDDKLSLKKTHAYYFQIQMQLAICERLV